MGSCVVILNTIKDLFFYLQNIKKIKLDGKTIKLEIVSRHALLLLLELLIHQFVIA